ncbi:MAG: hypothetical protein PWQ08_841 [Clostridiales bacterium]|nr:hypothetical protein [Clostridiales bacterium]
MVRKLNELTVEQWERIKPLLPPEQSPRGGRPAKDNKLMLNAMLYRYTTGVTWRELPVKFGPWQSVYGRFHSWVKSGLWEQIMSIIIPMATAGD